MLNIVVPMAGRGSRFANAGYQVPKPWIEVYGHPMIEYVVKNITPNCSHRFLFICQQEHLQNYDAQARLEKMAPGCEVIAIDHITQGAACTVLLAEKWIDHADALMIANSDQFVDTDINAYLEKMGMNDGLIMTMPAQDPKWSYIQYDANGFVTLVKEKEVISNQATVGIYNYQHGCDFVQYAHQMIEKDIRVNNEFYVAPVYNEMIEAGKKIIYSDVGQHMYGTGTPEDLKQFMQTQVCKRLFQS